MQRKVLSFIFVFFLCSSYAISQPPVSLTENEAFQLGTEAYIYGYPLIMMDKTREVMTNVEKPAASKAPIGVFANIRTYPTATYKEIIAPNADTLYSLAWLDLSNGPYVFHVPYEGDRYYLMPMLSGWTDVFANPGTRTTGTKSHSFLITGPGWQGVVPGGMTELKSPTNIVWIVGRTYSTGTGEDYKIVHTIQDQYRLTPFKNYGKAYTPPQGKIDPSIDMKTPVREQVNNMNAAAYFKRLAALMKNNPPAPEDAPMVEKLKKLGIIPGQEFDINKLNPATVVGLNRAVLAAQAQIVEHFKYAGIKKNGWTFSFNTGKYGTDYLQRAFISYFGFGANLPEDAVYPTAKVDSKGNVLTGANKYILHFAKEQIPPVHGFWSLTMYDDKLFFVNNSLNRYNVSPRNKLVYNSDGSLDLYIQHDSPNKEKESNWLPAPEGNFILMLRLYWPKAEVLNGTWVPPGVTKTN